MEQRSSAQENGLRETDDSARGLHEVHHAFIADACDRRTMHQITDREKSAPCPAGLPDLSIFDQQSTTSADRKKQGDPTKQAHSAKPSDSNEHNLNWPDQETITSASGRSSEEAKESRARDAAMDSPKHSAPDGKAEKGKWTVVVDLGMSALDQGVKEGSDRQLAELKELAEKTRGTGVTIVVQKLTTGERGDRGTIERCLIRDGQISPLKSEKSQGYSRDLKELLQLSVSQAPFDKIALVSQTHGLGAAGVLADNGPCSLDELKSAIKDGLAGSGHGQLDVMDFDACIMGSQSVEDKFHDLARHIVSSEEVESGSGKDFDCQSLKTVVGDLLKAPDLTAAQLADDFVDAARRGANGTPASDTGKHGGTDTLAHFDSSKYEAFKDSLDRFGKALSSVAGNQSARSKLQSIIQSTPSFPEDSQVSGERDLKTLVQQVRQAAGDGSLPDPTHEIERSAQALLQAQKDMTSSYWGEGRLKGGYDQMGGLSIFLPHGNVGEQARRAVEGELTSSIYAPGAPSEAVLQMARSRLLDYSALSPEARAQLTGAETAERSMESAKTDADFQKASSDFDSALKDLKGSRLEAELVEKTISTLKRSRITELEQHAPNTGAWKDFLKLISAYLSE